MNMRESFYFQRYQLDQLILGVRSAKVSLLQYTIPCICVTISLLCTLYDRLLMLYFVFVVSVGQRKKEDKTRRSRINLALIESYRFV